jgi:hypothetical protein
MFPVGQTRKRTRKLVVVLICHQRSPDDPIILRCLSSPAQIRLSPAHFILLRRHAPDYSASCGWAKGAIHSVPRRGRDLLSLGRWALP